jgi:N-acetylneuraminic acid mutarotase
VFFGTDDKFDQLNDVWEFDPSKKSWTKIAEYLENLYAGPVIC